jgi:hypothetical protein
VVELGLEPYDPRVGALTIHYRTVDDTVP